MRSKLVAGTLFAVLTGIVFSLSLTLNSEDRFKPISSDAEGYYQYLTAVFIKHDITSQPYSYYMENGTLFNKYTCGVAMMEMPFFLGAHAFTKLTDPEAATGYTDNYIYAVQLAAAFYLVAGMFFLFYFLRRYFPVWAVLTSLLLIYVATNLFYYVHGECGMSHVFSFFLFAGIIYFTPYFLGFRKIKYTIAIALLMGISVLLRPTNIIIGLFFLFYDVYSITQLRDRFLLLLRNWWHFAIIVIAAVIIYIPQMYYWHKTLGKYFVNSYRYDYAVTGFINWRQPKIFQVLAGHRSGWLIYTPIMILSLAGIVWTFYKRSFHSRALLFIFLVLLYLSASWSAYTYGGAYGFRPFVELYAFLSIPFTFITWKIFSGRSILIKLVAFVFIANCIYLNIRFFDLYNGAWDGMGWHWENVETVIEQAYYITPS